MSGSSVIAGILLAAGAGRRYGKPKILVEGWLEGAVAALRDGGCGHVGVVVGAATLPVPDGAVAVTASDWDTGLSASVRAGLGYADRIRADYAVLHVIDTPDVGAAVVRRVIERAVASRGGLARAVFGDQPGHPVVVASAHWPQVIGGLTGDQGAGRYLRTARDVDNVDCSDLAGGADHDHPV